MKWNIRKFIKRLLALLYIICSYIFITYFLSYNIREVNGEPLSQWLIVIGAALMFYVVYVIINHLVIKRVFSEKTIVVADVFLLVNILILTVSGVVCVNCSGCI